MEEISDDQKIKQPAQKTSINNLSMTISTTNGSGSGTSNKTLHRAIFKMGVPISGKNIIPSNIKGMPTWYSIRVNQDGFLSRQESDDILVAMQAASIEKDIAALKPGGVLFYNQDLEKYIQRTDICCYPMPIKELTKDFDVPSELRDYVENMAYVGIVAQMLRIDFQAIKQALAYHFNGKEKPVESNYAIIQHAANWAETNLVKTDPYEIRPMDKNKGMIMVDGNTAGALGAIYGGVQFCGWYPITPSTSMIETLREQIVDLRRDVQTGKSTYAIVQAEDELAAIGMVVGAGWAGLRAMTSTSGPGLSLMAEYLGLAYFAEVPLVVWDVQRVGPSTGLPTRTGQSDLRFAANISHGDTQFVLLTPGTVKECFEDGWKAFDIAERLQTPVLILSDLDLGMNEWSSDKFEYPDAPLDRGKIVWEDDMEAIIKKMGGIWGRYLDIDGDGIPYRAVPGNLDSRSAYFTRGTGHDEFAGYSEEPQDWEKLLNRLLKKSETAKKFIPQPIISNVKNARIGLICWGSTHDAVLEAQSILMKWNFPVDFMRVRAVPFRDEVTDFIHSHDYCYVVELNRDGHLRQLLLLEYPDYASNLIHLSHIDGQPLSAEWVVDQIKAREGR
jgi:2-oxoglutarate ferredoxin oxidoreductase subunit alpha